jgi:hypothetical protein
MFCGLCPREVLPNQNRATCYRTTFHLTCLVRWLRSRYANQTWQIALVLLLSVLLPVVSILALSNPTPHTQQHKSNWDYWNTVRIVPMKITEVSGNKVYFSRPTRIKAWSFDTDEATQVPKDSSLASTSQFTVRLTWFSTSWFPSPHHTNRSANATYPPKRIHKLQLAYPIKDTPRQRK